MKVTGLAVPCGIALLVSLAACQNRAIQTVTIYESPSSFVRLEVDPTVDTDRGHSHPANVTTDQMRAALSGLMIQEPTHLITFFDKEHELPRHPAFNVAEIGLLAPLLAKGLAMATSEEIVTFYQSRQETAIVRKVTSGGVFIDGDELHIVLSNYRSPTHYAADPGVSDTTDDWLTPMRSIAPQEAKLDFEPTSAVAPSREAGLTSLLSVERREVVVRVRQLAPAKAGAGREPDRGAEKTR